MSEMHLERQVKSPNVIDGIMPGLVWAFRIHADGSPEQLPIDAPIESRHDGWLWLHFNLADARACNLLRGLPAVPASAVAALLGPDGHQQLQVDESCVFGIFADHICDLNGVTKEIGYLHFVMTDGLLISTRRHALSAAEITRQALLGGCKLSSVASLLEMIVDHIIESIDHYADEIAIEMDEVEEELLTRDISDQRQRLALVRKATVRLHRQIQGMCALFRRVGRQLDLEPRPHLHLPAGELLQRLEGLGHEIIAMRERAQLLQEEVTLKVAEETNRSLHILTIITTFFLPANLVAGIFGMNTKGLPFAEDDSGFIWAIVILVSSSALILLLLRGMKIVGPGGADVQAPRKSSGRGLLKR
jgi:zinc transporter